MSGWPLRKIDDIAIFLNAQRKPFKASERARRQGPFPYYGASGIIDWVDDHLFEGEYLLVSDVRKSTLAFMATGKFWVNANVHILDEKEPGILRWLSWVLNRTDLSGYITGAVQPHLIKSTFSQVEVPVPPTKERLRINSVLKAIDDKIELNRKMAATLEEMARQLYRSWFVNFDPVRAKVSNSAPVHMETQTAALFPNSFSENGLPTGWKRSTIGEVADIVGGATPNTKESAYWKGGGCHLWATPKDLSTLEQPVLSDTNRKITDAGLAKISSGLSPAGSLLLSSRAPIGYLAIAKKPMAVNQGFIVIRETKKISGVEAYFWCIENMDLIHANANGSTFQEISKKNFRPLRYALAPRGVRKAFNQKAGGLLDRISAAFDENQILVALLDTLIPRLMSGELCVGEAREQIETAT